MTEEHPFNNRTMYGATKIAGEQFFRAFNEQHGLDYVGLRYMNVYGPRMDYQGAYVSVIMKVLDRIDAGEPPVIFGDGSQAYDFVHVARRRARERAGADERRDRRVLQRRHRRQTTIRELVDIAARAHRLGLEPRYRRRREMFVTNRVGVDGAGGAAARLSRRRCRWTTGLDPSSSGDGWTSAPAAAT